MLLKYAIRNFLHFLGLAFGVGGVTIAAIISRKADKDADLGKQFMKIIPGISKLIWFGLLLLIISGVGISFYVKVGNSNLLIIKHVLVLWITIFGIVIGVKMKKMKNLAPLNSKGKISLEFLNARKQVKVFSTINLILWYLVVILSVFI